jgi:hypothetical protein
MAARTRVTFHNEETRRRIQTTMLVNRLQDHVRGKVKMSPTQVTAALGLLKKTIPDLAAVQLVDETVRAFVIEAPAVMPQELWLQRRGQPLLAGEVAPELTPDAPVTPHPGPCIDLKAAPEKPKPN